MPDMNQQEWEKLCQRMTEQEQLMLILSARIEKLEKADPTRVID